MKTIKELASNATIEMYPALKKVLKEAYALTTYDDEEVSIGVEALIYNDISDFPIGGYVYATHVWEEGNCGVYHSIKWLENLLKEMVQSARQVHIKDAQATRYIINMNEFDYDQEIDQINETNRPQTLQEEYFGEEDDYSDPMDY